MGLPLPKDDLRAFNLRETSRLTGLSEHRLRGWDKAGIFRPRYTGSDEYRSHPRLYSFQDVVGLRALARLRDWRVPLDEVRKVQSWLREKGDKPWSQLRVSVINRREVCLHDAEQNHAEAPPREQPEAMLELGRLAEELDREAERLRQRSPADIGQVTRKRGVMGGDWVLAGTRIPTSAVWSFHEAGYDTAGIIEQYPSLTPEDIQAAIQHEKRLRETRRQRRVA